MQFFTFQPIVEATIIGFLFGAVWYSPVLFMKAWLYGEGITKKDIPKRSKLYILQINLYTLIAHGAIASVLALIFDLLQVSTLKVAVSLGLLLSLGFIVSTRYIDMLYTIQGNHWGKVPQVKFLVSSGYYILVCMIISGALFYLV